MDFLTFFGYFLASALILDGLKIGVRFLIIKRMQRKAQKQFENEIKNGGVQVMSLEDLVNKIKQQQRAASSGEGDDDKGKKTWH